MTNETVKRGKEPVRRRRHYLDRSLQGWLLVGLIALEVTLFSIAMLILYQDLNAVVEARLYSAHVDPGGDMPALLQVTLRLLGGLLLINLFAVFVADRLWSRRVNHITGDLRQVLKRVGALDFSRHCPVAEDHAVLAAACRWQSVEAERCQHIREVISALQTTDTSDKAIVDTREKLQQLRKLLPNTHGTTENIQGTS